MNHTVELRSLCCLNRLKSAVNAKVFSEGVQGVKPKSAIFGAV